MGAARGVLEDDSEQALTVVVPRDQGSEAWDRLRERMECGVVIDVIH
jgi:hypothetical protein